MWATCRCYFFCVVETSLGPIKLADIVHKKRVKRFLHLFYVEIYNMRIKITINDERERERGQKRCRKSPNEGWL